MTVTEAVEAVRAAQQAMDDARGAMGAESQRYIDALSTLVAQVGVTRAAELLDMHRVSVHRALRKGRGT